MERPLILAVEDNQTQRRLLSLIAQRFQYDFHVVASCAEAIEAVSMRRYAIILMDWSLGDGDGLECTRQIREIDNQRAEHTPVIAVTGHVMVGDRERCLEAGADDYLSKPFSLGQLKTIVDKWLSTQAKLVEFSQTAAWQTENAAGTAGEFGS